MQVKIMLLLVCLVCLASARPRHGKGGLQTGESSEVMETRQTLIGSGKRGYRIPGKRELQTGESSEAMETRQFLSGSGKRGAGWGKSTRISETGESSEAMETRFLFAD